MEAIEGIKAEPRPQAYVYEFGENSINFAVRFWHDSQISTEWEVRDLLARRMKEELDRTGIDIPFPQMVLHMVSGSSQDSIQESPRT